MTELYDVNEFWKFMIRVGLVVEAERVARTKKLIKMTVDFGDERRTVITGIADQYSPEDLIGKRMMFVTNLKPKKIAGVESEAMLLVAEEESGRVHLIEVPKSVPLGTRVY
ncbi:MAG TPA: methionine--tRNA ligase subunit beta [Thermoprotei archaeon]|nr:methionine--tRNA ligase subunit beta [Euryarchaeota archaeon]MCD6158669.1 methionine--tRNA ligase subunit beta [Euryarchaeota archaeon]RLF67551.1 MAG: methionine--tRNA ligase subunit beta [Thermoplasmata archaeon]HDJ51394.1 methionine--tRNA ligase subunit beta [Thermoprotei archaeon]